jgi:ribulose-5-phosphate 4-epimerase/fuculose-1-phosphate aldolase
MESESELREKIALSCRILAQHGLFKGSTGHVSTRAADGGPEMLIRGRPDVDRGLQFAEPSDVMHVDLNGKRVDNTSGVRSPGEVYLHSEIYKRSPGVNAVVHAHPPGVVLCTIAGVKIRPIYGAFDASGMRLAMAGLPLYERAITISTPELGVDMIEVMGDHEMLLLYGHGIAACGATVEEATHRAIAIETLARMNWFAAQRFDVPDISDEDKAEWVRRDAAGASRGRIIRTDWLSYLGQLETGATLIDDTGLGFGLG